ncbi:hypothetical protein Godav_029104, partial [Gossypium davidsonii]|nr:hypothetical protein [Gossypium davidsonii]
MSTSKIRTLVKRKYYWSTMRPWRCTSQTEYYGNLDIDNRFPWHLRCLMISTKSTYEERQRQLRVQRERRGLLNPRRRDDDAGPSTRPRHSPGPSSAAIQSPGPTRTPTQSPDPTIQPTIPMTQHFQMMPGAYPSPFMYPNPYMFPF